MANTPAMQLDEIDRKIMNAIDNTLSTVPYVHSAHYPSFWATAFGLDHHWQQQEREVVFPLGPVLAKNTGNPLCAISEYHTMVYDPDATKYELVIYHRRSFDTRGGSGKTVMMMRKLFAGILMPWNYNETQFFGIAVRAYDMSREKQNPPLPFSQFGLSLVNNFLEIADQNLLFTVHTFNPNGSISRSKTAEDVSAILWLLNAFTDVVY